MVTTSFESDLRRNCDKLPRRNLQNGSQHFEIAVIRSRFEAENLGDEGIKVHIFKGRDGRMGPDIRADSLEDRAHGFELLGS
jgi:hypothetical protein